MMKAHQVSGGYTAVIEKNAAELFLRGWLDRDVLGQRAVQADKNLEWKAQQQQQQNQAAAAALNGTGLGAVTGPWKLYVRWMPPEITLSLLWAVTTFDASSMPFRRGFEAKRMLTLWVLQESDSRKRFDAFGEVDLIRLTEDGSWSLGQSQDIPPKEAIEKD